MALKRSLQTLGGYVHVAAAVEDTSSGYRCVGTCLTM